MYPAKRPLAWVVRAVFFAQVLLFGRALFALRQMPQEGETPATLRWAAFLFVSILVFIRFAAIAVDQEGDHPSRPLLSRAFLLYWPNSVQGRTWHLASHLSFALFIGGAMVCLGDSEPLLVTATFVVIVAPLCLLVHRVARSFDRIDTGGDVPRTRITTVEHWAG